MSVNLTASGRWKAQCVHEGARFYIGLYHSREAALAAVAAEYDKLRNGTSLHVQGKAGLTTRDYASLIGVPVGTVKRWLGEGLPAARSGNLVRINPDEGHKWVVANHADSVSFGRESVVYVVQRDTDRAVKIGWTNDVERRLRELRRDVKAAVTLVACLPGDKPAELRLHALFVEQRLDGEWFAAPVNDVVSALRSA